MSASSDAPAASIIESLLSATTNGTNGHSHAATNGHTHTDTDEGNCPGIMPGSSHDMTAHLRQVFATCKAEGRPAFIAYLTVGFPSLDGFIASIRALQDGGADIIELGIPFTDPLADGNTIQHANQVALDNGVTDLQHSIDITRQAREAGVTVPIVFMGYYNPFRVYGEDRLFSACKAAGVSGFIIVDLPPEESDTFRTLCRSHHLSFIPLIAPTTSPTRIRHLSHCADSFIYCVSLTGVTGARSSVSSGLPALIDNVRANSDLPIAIGFGISTAEQFAEVGKMGDGVVVGSAIINTLDKAQPDSRVKDLLAFCRSITGRSASSVHHAPIVDPLYTPHAIKSTPAIPGARFGQYGGRYVPETLVRALEELEVEYEKAKNDPAFHAEVRSYWDYIGRPSRLHQAERLTEFAGGARIWLKREDLNHTGAHKVNNAIAQAILAKRLGKARLIAETGAGQHGVATATICAKLGIPLTVYMGSEDVERQSLNVIRMQLLGTKVVPVNSGSRTLKDAINEAMRDWVTNITTTHYLIGSAIGPHPFPTIVRDFQSVIGDETRQWFLEHQKKLPDAVVACVGGGSNAIGMFYPFKDDPSVRMLGCEAGGQGLHTPHHSATLAAGTPGVLHGTRTYLLQDKTGQITATHSISAGLDYPGVGPEHAHLKDSQRAEYIAVTDAEAMLGFRWLTEFEGIIPALESSHAVYGAVQMAKGMSKEQDVVICVSGRGDKDLSTVIQNVDKYYHDKPDIMQSVQFMKINQIGIAKNVH